MSKKKTKNTKTKPTKKARKATTVVREVLIVRFAAGTKAEWLEPAAKKAGQSLRVFARAALLGAAAKALGKKTPPIPVFHGGRKSPLAEAAAKRGLGVAEYRKQVLQDAAKV